jgi:GT2 family glycosyltransferase
MAKGLKNKPTAYNRPFDSGLSACRNFLIDNTDGDYILLLDDDFIFTENTRIMKMKKILENNTKIGIVGGTVKNEGQETHFECVLEKEGDTLYQRPDEDDWKDCNGIPYKLTGCVLNFAMMRRKIFNDIRWDDKIKIKGEHTDFYLRLKDTKWKVAFCPEVKIDHEHISTGEYRDMRMRDDFFLMMMQKHGLKKYVYLNGRTFEVQDGKMINYKSEKPITIKTI